MIPMWYTNKHRKPPVSQTGGYSMLIFGIIRCS